MIYLDNAATTRIDPAVFTSMLPWLTEKYGNPGSLYDFGREAADAVDYARYIVASTFHAEKEQIIFTAGGSEGNNLVIKGLAPHMKESGKTTILYSAVEHDSVRRAVADLCDKFGFSGKIIPVHPDGKIDMDALSNMLDDTVGLVSVMHTNNELGTMVWDGKLVPLCREKGVLVHCDCVQAAYDYDLDCSRRASSPDFAVISSHKIHGPKGVGAVYAREPDLLSSLISGGADQEHGKRGGTENVAGIVGFAKACSMVTYGEADTARCDPELYSGIFVEELQAKYNGEIRVNSSSPSKTVNLCIPGVDAQSLVLAAGSSGVCISAGSACRSNETEPSHVLKAIGLSDEDARSSIRVSFSRMNNEYEVREGARVIARCAEALKGDGQ